MSNYYEDEFLKLDPSSTYLQVQISDDNNKTKWLTLNEESIKAIRAFLITVKKKRKSQ